VSFDLARALARFRDDGFVILEGGLDRSALDELVAALQPFEAGRPRGRNDIEGEASTRIYSLAGKGEPFRRLAEHPWIMAMCDALLLPHFLLSTMQSIRLHPGETAQPWHTDDAFYLVPRPRSSTLAVSVIWAIEDFTADNGATEIVRGSHRWAAEHPDDRAAAGDVVRAIMPAGSAIVFDGATWHRGGANHAATATRLAISPQYNQPYFRPQESQLLIVPPDAARACTDRMRSMLGYSIHPPFVGQVDGMHPLRLVDPSYRSHKGEDRVVADRILARPTAVFGDPAT
jgi:ectoine hydroxylase-related dioxygenase (phytanoyl-CoA dioxygenase family)